MIFTPSPAKVTSNNITGGFTNGTGNFPEVMRDGWERSVGWKAQQYIKGVD